MDFGDSGGGWGYDPTQDPNLGQIDWGLVDPNTGMPHYTTGVDQGLPPDYGGMPTGGNDAGPWYGPTDSNGGNNPPSGSTNPYPNQTDPWWKKAINTVNGPGGGSGGSGGNLAPAALLALGEMLKSLFAKPLFQPKQSLLTGTAQQQGQALTDFRSDIAGKQANNPANATPGTEEVRKWLSMAIGQ